MTTKRPISPGPIDLMEIILNLVAEPNSANSKKKPEKQEVPHVRNSGNVINNVHCDMCAGGGNIVNCANCPRSYHTKCHIPIIKKVPAGEWLCRHCTIGNAELNPEVPINDNIGKTENDDISDYVYMDEERFEVGTLPNLLNKLKGSSDSRKCMRYNDFKIMLSAIITATTRLKTKNPGPEEVTIQRKNSVRNLSARKQLDKSNLIRRKDRCCICKRGTLRGKLVQCHYCNRLYHVNCLDPPLCDWDRKTRWICPAHDKFFTLVYPKLFTADCGVRSDSVTMKRLRCVLPELPVNKYINVPSHIDAMYKKPEENIPKSSTENYSLNVLCDVASVELESLNSSHKINNDNISNDVYTKFPTCQGHDELQTINCIQTEQPFAKLSSLSLHVNISIQKNIFTIGKSLRNNLCLRPYGNCEFVSDYHATIIFDETIGDYLVRNHSRHGIIVDNISYFGTHRPIDHLYKEKQEIDAQVHKYINNRRMSVRKRDMFCIYRSDDSDNVSITYNGEKREFDKEPILKYYTSKFSKMKHGYKKIKCKCSRRLVPKNGYAGQAVLHNDSMIMIGCMKFIFSLGACEKKFFEMCTEKSSSKRNRIVKNKPLNGKRLKYRSGQENGLVKSIDGTRNEPTSIVTINGRYSLGGADDKNFYSDEQNANINCTVIDIDGFDNDSPSSTDVILLCSAAADFSRANNWNYANNTSNDNQKQSCCVNDLIQEFEVNESSVEGETVEEEFVYEINNFTEADNSAAQRVGDMQDWIIEEIVVDEDKSFNCNGGNEFKSPVDSQQLESTTALPNHNNTRGDYKTEHMYCARSPSHNEPIVITSSDEEYD